jgi:hypothetical protein
MLSPSVKLASSSNSIVAEGSEAANGTAG